MIIIDHVSNNKHTIFKIQTVSGMIMDDMSNNKDWYGTVDDTNINNNEHRWFVKNYGDVKISNTTKFISGGHKYKLYDYYRWYVEH